MAYGSSLPGEYSSGEFNYFGTVAYWIITLFIMVAYLMDLFQTQAIFNIPTLTFFLFAKQAKVGKSIAAWLKNAAWAQATRARGLASRAGARARLTCSARSASAWHGSARLGEHSATSKWLDRARLQRRRRCAAPCCRTSPGSAYLGHF